MIYSLYNEPDQVDSHASVWVLGSRVSCNKE